MTCHICPEPAIGQCPTCWKFYCASHGDILCQSCQPEPEQPTQDAPGLSGAAQMPGSMRATTLERVVPIAETKTCGKTELTLISLELYEDGFSLGYLARELEQPPPMSSATWMFPRMLTPLFSARDDRGSTYSAGFSGAGGGQGGVSRGGVRFTPSVDPTIKKLTLRVEQLAWMAHGGGPSRIDEGRWEFEVAL
jgi:hypothetical protein